MNHIHKCKIINLLGKKIGENLCYLLPSIYKDLSCNIKSIMQKIKKV